jgi:SAM-dependent methyltransferase
MVRDARPFYSEYAWAYDLLIDRPVRKECGAITTWLVERGVLPGSRLLDAGCGTGRYVAELGRRGYVVHGIDASPDLIREAKRSLGEDVHTVSVTVGDILAAATSRFDAILCRGVLNDLVDERARRSVFDTFSRALRSEGVLVFDVREWEATAERKAREPLFRKSVPTDRGILTFSSVTRLDEDRHRLMLTERHTLKNDDGERSSDYEFTMQCWTYDELTSWLPLAGFGSVAYFGAYDPAVPAGATDRLVIVAQRLPAAA